MGALLIFFCYKNSEKMSDQLSIRNSSISSSLVFLVLKENNYKQAMELKLGKSSRIV